MAALFQPYLRLRLKLCRLWWWTNGVTCTEKMTSRWRTNKHDLTLLFLWKTGLTFGCLCGEIFEKRIMRRSFLWIIKYMRAPVQEGLLTKSEPRWREDGTWCQAWSWTWWTRGRSTVERVAWQRLVDFPGVLFPRGQVDYGDGDCIARYHWISGTRRNTAFYFFNSQLTSMLGSWMQGAGLSWCYLRCHRWSWRGWISSPHPTAPPWTWQDWLMSHRRIWRQENWGKFLFSAFFLQFSAYLSPWWSLANWSPTMHWKVGPKRLPTVLLSLMPPIKRSTSSTSS